MGPACPPKSSRRSSESTTVRFASAPEGLRASTGPPEPTTRTIEAAAVPGTGRARPKPKGYVPPRAMGSSSISTRRTSPAPFRR
jgi:hypothetical protein